MQPGAAATHFRRLRLPELFCGLGRSDGDALVHYPVSCSPQAWASGAPFLLLRACLGLYPDAPRKTLKIVNPRLPEWLSELTIEGLRVGQTRLTVHFAHSGEGTFATVREMIGEPLAIRLEIGAHREPADG